MIKITYYYSACVAIETPDTGILCDPWFTEGVYDGSWYHYPPFDRALERVRQYPYVYVSHIHPDHYDPRFLREYLRRYPATRVLIAPFQPNFLARKMAADGIPCHIVGEEQCGETRFALVPNELEPLDIDSALVVRWRDRSAVNMNDNILNPAQIARIRELVGGSPTFALLGYTGAGPYPQTYFDDPKVLARKADEKREQFLVRYRAMRDALDPKIALPFAGKYLLGGRLHALNEYRGVADAVEVKRIDPSAVVLADGGEAFIDSETLRPSATRDRPYDRRAMREYAASLADRPMDYERFFGGLALGAVPFRRLFEQASRRASSRSSCEKDHYFCFRLGEEWMTVNVRRDAEGFAARSSVEALLPRSEVEIDPRYLFGLLTGVFHWNNAEVGSQYRVRRFPDERDLPAQRFLSFLSVI